MDNRETLTPSSGDAILKRHLFSEVARNWIKGRGHIERAYFVRRPSRQSFGFRVAASSGPIPKAPGSAGGYLLLLWQILSGTGWREIGLAEGTCTLSEAVFGSIGSQGSATDVLCLRVRAGRSWGPQEHSADGGAACTW